MRLIRIIVARWLLWLGNRLLGASLLVCETYGPRDWRVKSIGPAIRLGIGLASTAVAIAPWLRKDENAHLPAK